MTGGHPASVDGGANALTWLDVPRVCNPHTMAHVAVGSSVR
jgi:hypothetical protein